MSALLTPDRVAALHLHARAAVAADVDDVEQVVVAGGARLAGTAAAAERGDLVGFAAHFGGVCSAGFVDGWDGDGAAIEDLFSERATVLRV